jgi:hypothetical protein
MHAERLLQISVCEPKGALLRLESGFDLSFSEHFISVGIASQTQKRVVGFG